LLLAKNYYYYLLLLQFLVKFQQLPLLLLFDQGPKQQNLKVCSDSIPDELPEEILED
jgi:hypothetical protein